MTTAAGTPASGEDSDEKIVAETRGRLRAALTTAMRARDAAAVSALRSSLGAIDNAESAGVDAGPVWPPRDGLGAGEAPRRRLTATDVDALLRAEVEERRSAADAYALAGQRDHAERLRHEAAAVAAHLGERPPG
jgi:uncharacterized protein YqeY